MAAPEYNELTDEERRIVEDSRLRFVPPYVEYSSNPEGFAFHWRQMQLAFDLPDPSQIPPLKEPLDARDSAAVRRFVASCRELSSYSLLNHSGGFSVSWTKDGGSSITADNPPKETLRGFSVLFRQIHDDTNASFKVVSMILQRSAARAEDEGKTEREHHARRWRSTRSALLQETLHDIAQKKIHQAMGASPEYSEVQRRHTPLELLSLFNYGDYIHWGDKREQHDALVSDPFDQATTEFQFHLVMIGLAHFYLGYATLLESAFPSSV